MDDILKYFKSRWIGFALTLFSILLVSFLHWVGVFDIIEMKTYDFRFHRVRGPLTGWTAKDSSFAEIGTDIVLLEVDDEAWRLMPEEWPYPRGTVWGKVIRNLYQAGAKVIAFDIQFDSPETKSEYLHSFINELDQESIINMIPQYGDTVLAGEINKALPYMVPRHGDQLLAESIAEARAHGTEVVINVKMVTEPNRQPPQYISYPIDEVMAVNPETGLINDQMDDDGFSRRYAIAGYMAHEPDRAYLTLGMKAVKAFADLPDTTVPRYNADDRTWTYGPYTMNAYGRSNTFFVNYYGPASGYRLQTEESMPPWGTFPRFSVAHVIDTEDINLRDPVEDVDWMTQFIPGEVPEWIMAIEDPVDRAATMEALGIGGEFDVTTTPFYNKIVVIGVAIEVIHDVKSTPYYNYMGVQQLTPGMETHANAIQTVLHKNFINTFGGAVTDLARHGFPIAQFLLITLLAFIAFFLLDYVNPIIAALLVFIEGIIYFGVVCGAFMNDYLWMVKVIFSPNSIVLPGIGESYVLPLVAPIVGIGITYVSNILYRFLNEQKDKKFLKNTFGAYISPDLIDQMYEEKQEPKLGGDAGYHTAFFSDIQSFSAFSEVMEPEDMVKLMNDYLTEMTTILLEHQGTLDKYIGDAIVAFYGAPVPVEEHELLACKTALAMEKKIVELRKKWSQEEDKPDIVHNLRHRVG
ncbi:MAG TPA: adenylate/guanylate cyclase domain-containing protein, partial [Candidatus Marinimicrobia bacterium]|nr:adenylate/guanylate cyclase domain-containing protein [Candidatus Neomarinimicrobiota bacterium]